MTVFVAHAPADRSAAEALEKVIERRGQFVELDDGVTALRPVMGGDVLVLLVSQALTFATARLRLEQRALDAWAEGRLIVVKLDHGFPPVGLRDLPAIDASFEAQREFKWNEVADAVRERMRTAPPVAGGVVVERAAAKGDLNWLRIGVKLLLAAPGLFAIAVVASIWLVNRIGPTPGGLAETWDGANQFGERYGAPDGVTAWAFLVAIAVLAFVAVPAVIRAVVAVALMLAGLATRRAPRTEAPPSADTTSDVRVGDAVFVSYARANEGAVLPVIEAAKKAGRKFWLDQKGGVSAGDGWAGEIVRAIRGSASVVVMCSKAAFESDHVKREIYLADRYKKKLAPVFIEAAEPPEDFEYFFAGVQPLKLFETPEAERPEALIRVLG